MSRKSFHIMVLIFDWALGASLCPAKADQAAVTSYPAPYFQGAQLATAYDMVGRLPGFVFDAGISARGFAGTAGNVLIDGARPTAKIDDLQAILTRIPADRVERIDLIRGGAPGIDMQGQSVIANVILKRDDSLAVIAQLTNILYADRTDAPGGSLEFVRRNGDRVYDAAITRYGDVYDDAAGSGTYLFTTPGAGSESGSVRRPDSLRQGWGLNGSMSLTLLGGVFGANATAQSLFFNDGLAYGPPLTANFAETKKVTPGELGLHWDADLGANRISLLALARLEQDRITDTANGIDVGAQLFSETRTASESILRGTWRYGWSDALMLESGAEGAYNTLNGRSQFLDNNVAVTLPAADARVNERRGEIFAQATWKFSADGLLEGGARFELSHISALGVPSRGFAFIKPRILFSWAPWPNAQLRLRAERVAGQLDFTNFVASADLSGAGVSAGNLNLRPDRRWQYEGAYEVRFWDKGAVTAGVMHEEISDLVDFIPIGGGLDGPGNVHKAENDEFKLTFAIPFDALGAAGGLLKGNLQWDDSALSDPVAGQARSISGQRDRNITFEYSQDVAAWNSTFDVLLNPGGWSRPSYRIAQVSKTRLLTPYLQASWNYKPRPDLDIIVEADDFLPYHLNVEQDNYAGPRDRAALSQRQDIRNSTEPRLFLQLRKTF
jgi:hypothetical protein